MSGLAETRCTACRSDEPTLTDAEIGELSRQVPGWRVEERHGVKRPERVPVRRLRHDRENGRALRGFSERNFGVRDDGEDT